MGFVFCSIVLILGIIQIPKTVCHTDTPLDNCQHEEAAVRTAIAVLQLLIPVGEKEASSPGILQNPHT